MCSNPGLSAFIHSSNSMMVMVKKSSLEEQLMWDLCLQRAGLPSRLSELGNI